MNEAHSVLQESMRDYKQNVPKQHDIDESIQELKSREDTTYALLNAKVQTEDHAPKAREIGRTATTVL